MCLLKVPETSDINLLETWVYRVAENLPNLQTQARRSYWNHAIETRVLSKAVYLKVVLILILVSHRQFVKIS